MLLRTFQLAFPSLDPALLDDVLQLVVLADAPASANNMEKCLLILTSCVADGDGSDAPGELPQPAEIQIVVAGRHGGFVVSIHDDVAVVVPVLDPWRMNVKPFQFLEIAVCELV